jgi:hypothetical protein
MERKKGNTHLQTRWVTKKPSEGRASNNQKQDMIINAVRDGWEF